jgi:hypothetical protein
VQARSNLVRDENGHLLADSHNILNRWKNYFTQLLNVRRVSDARHIEIYIKTELLVPDPSSFEVKIAIAKSKIGLNRQVLIKFRQNLFKQEVKYYVIISIS